MANYLDVAGDKGLTAFQRAIGQATTLKLLDDNNGGTTDATFLLNLDDVCQRGSADVDAFLSEAYGGTWPTVVDPTTGKYAQRIREATLRLAVGYAYDRVPEFCRAISGEGPLLSVTSRKIGREILTELKTGVQGIVEATPAKGDMLKGGVALAGGPRMTISSADGTDNSGDY